MDLLEHRESENINRHPWEIARYKVMQDLIKPYTKKIKPQKIADIGCGDTFIVSQLAKEYSSTEFYAIDNAFTREEIERFENNIETNNISLYKELSKLEELDNKIDLVLLMDVIEHIDDDKKFLRDLSNKKYISNNTLFLITVPAFQSLYTNHDKFLKHYRRYSRRELIQTLDNSGYKTLHSGYFFFSLLKIRTLQKLFEKAFGQKEQKGLAEKKYSIIMASILKSFLFLDYKLTRFFSNSFIKIPGLSTYAICQKSTQ